MADDIDAGTLGAAYGMAARAGDTTAMQNLHQRLLAAYQAQNRSSPVSDSDVENYAAGTGRGASRIILGGENLAGMGKETRQLRDEHGNLWELKQPVPAANPEASDEALKESDKRDKPLLDTAAGAAGNLTGQVAATVPLGAVTGPLARAMAVAKGAPTGLRLASAAGRTGLAAGENALQSAATADPDKQSEEAVSGAILGSILHGTGAAVGKGVKGLVGKTEAAENLYRDADEAGHDLFIPISQGGKGPAKIVYQHVLPYAIGAGEQLDTQAGKAERTTRDILAENATPEVNGAKLKAPIGNTPEQTAADLKTQFDKEYQDKLKSHAFSVPEDFHDTVVARLKSEFPELPETHVNQIAGTVDKRLQEYASNGQITGGNLQEVLDAARQDLNTLKEKNIIRSPPAMEAGLEHVKGLVDDEISKNQEILANPKVSETDRANAQEAVSDLQNYKKLSGQYKEAAPVIAATEASPENRGNFPFSSVAKRAAPGTRARTMAQDATEVFGETPGTASPAGRHVLREAVGTAGALAGGAAFGHPLFALGAIGAGNVLATKTAQKALYGDLGAQKVIAAALRKNPQLAYQTGLAGREAVNAARQ